MISFTEHMNKSLSFRKHLTAYCLKEGNEAKEIRSYLKMLDCFDAKSENDEIFRNEVFNWLNKKSSTIKLRDLAFKVGYDYWQNLSNANIIDTFDIAIVKR